MKQSCNITHQNQNTQNNIIMLQKNIIRHNTVLYFIKKL